MALQTMTKEMSRPRALVMDDDKSSRDEAMVLLRKVGFEPFASRNAGEALRLIKEEARFEFLLLDLFPGDFPGSIVADYARVHLPEVRILFYSQQPEEDMRASGYLQPEHNYVEKPLTRFPLERYALELNSRTVHSQ